MSILVGIASAGGPMAFGHISVSKERRVGAYPSYDGAGWVAAVWLDLPLSAVENTVTAENYIAGRKPDFTFRTPWIDFPAGPTATVADADLPVVGDFFDDYIFDVSDPTLLDEPMSHMAVRFTGLLKVTLEDEVRIRPFFGYPIWIELGQMGYDGYVVRVGGEICCERPDTNRSDPWFNFGPAVGAQGLFPVDALYFNRYDPADAADAPLAGFELYSWYEGGLAHPAGQNMVHAEFGPGTLVPPWVIYQPQDALPVPPGDFDADTDVDLKDFQWFAACFFPPDGFIILPDGCETFDLDGDEDVDWDDLGTFLSLMENQD